MIIGETFNNNEYYGYEEDNYDYLFKRKSKEERQQKRAERKEKRAEKKQVRQVKRAEKKLSRQDPATGGKKKLQIFGNFGLFDKNKNKKTTGTSAAPGASGKTSTPGSSKSASSSSDDAAALTPEAKAAAEKAGAASASDSGSASGGESGAGENAKIEGANNAGDSSKKEAGMGAVFGFLALGVVVTVIGVVLFRSGKAEQPTAQPLKVAA